MNDVNVYKIAQIGGVVLAVIVIVLMRIRTYSMTTFIVWGILALVGAGIFFRARKLDEASRDK